MKKLTDALSALKKAVSAEGVVSMNAEALTTYATEQIEKMATDGDQGAARRAHLETVITDALDVYKSDTSAEAEFVPFAEPAAKPEPAQLDPNIAALADSVAKLTALMVKQAPEAAVAPVTDNEQGKPTTSEFHPPPIPEGHGATADNVGSAVATNQPQGDDGTPRADLTKGLASDTAASGGVTIPNAEDDDEFANGEDAILWPMDMNSAKAKASVTKSNGLTWGRDNEPAPTAR